VVMVIGWSGPGSFMILALADACRDRDAAIRRIFNEPWIEYSATIGDLQSGRR
jgi:hypothetical protein